MQADGVVALADIPKRFCQEWLPKEKKNQIITITPAINTFVADAIPDPYADSVPGNEIVFVSRMLDFKQPTHLFKALGKLKVKPKLNMIGYAGNDQIELFKNAAKQFGVEVEFHLRINDHRKYEVIKRSRIMVFPTKFEGYGMPPMESLYCRRPCVCYDLPILVDNYKDAVDFAPMGDVSALAEKIEK
jgi:glycosyltransferase involved in cell wall biosynthesis